MPIVQRFKNGRKLKDLKHPCQVVNNEISLVLIRRC
jgi:hypothetical protein